METKMIFSSITFLLYFLPITLMLYYLAPKRCKNGVLFLCSLFFYAWGEPVYVSLMLFSTALDYTCGRLIDKNRGTVWAKFFLMVSVVVNLGMLCTFKYSGMFARAVQHFFHYSLAIPSLALPIGISFYTFQTMSYSIDVYRNVVPVQKNILSFGTYVTLFPQLIAGPIVRYETVAKEIDHREHSFDGFSYGVRRFICGLAKKVLLANNIGLLWEKGSTQILQGNGSVFMAWLSLAAYGFQIYFDFSGYSDMAIGLGSMFGFHFCENFQYPFLAESITEFWRRWHISLGSWFRDYVYIPLGGSRKGLARQLLNIAIVWFLTGLWHGASGNFILWGIYFGILLVIEKVFLLRLLAKLPHGLGKVYMYLCVTASWVLFAFTDRMQGLEYFKTMIGRGQTVVWNHESMYLFVSYLPLCIICLLAATPLGSRIYQSIVSLSSKRKLSFCLGTGEIIVMTALLLLSITYLISGSYNPFLYFRF